MTPLLLLDKTEQSLRATRVVDSMRTMNLDAMLLSDNASKYYLTGRVFAGYIYITATCNITYAIQRPVDLHGDGVVYIRKPEELPGIIGNIPTTATGLEIDTLPYSHTQRLVAAIGLTTPSNASAVMRRAREIKTDTEANLIAESGKHQERVYRNIPQLYRNGMTDIELQIEIERASRLEGCLGQFRISGDSMELFMGNIIAGSNADTPSPYDFAMGGAGITPSLPVGANGTTITSGMTVMVDVNGNYTGYMTDMTRVFSLGAIPAEAVRAHECSINIHRELTAMGHPGCEARALYERACEIAREYDLEHLFMGHRQHARFIGHGVGIEINELPVIAPRSRDVIQPGQVIALEPKFVIPNVGAVGIENTYIVTASGWKCLTNAPNAIIPLQ